MSTTVIPDRVLQQILTEGIHHFRKHPKLLAVLFQSLTDKEFERVVKFISETSISISQNYPRKEMTPPAIVILLKNESESETFLGDHMGTTPSYGMPPQEHLYDTRLGHAASQSDVHGIPKKVVETLSVISATSDSVEVVSTDLSNFVNTLNGGLPELQLLVVAGAGKGKTYNIRRLTASSIDIEGQFVVPLDSSSKVDIRQINTLLPLGEPVRVFDEDSVLTRRGANFNVSYQIDVISGSQEEVIYLYSILKAILYSYKPLLEAQGIQNLGISGNDFGKRSEFLPDECFTRSLQINFSYAFSVIHEEEVYNQIRLAIFPECSDTAASDTLIDLGE